MLKRPYSAAVSTAAEALALAAVDEAISATNAMSQEGVKELKHIHSSVDKLVAASTDLGVLAANTAKATKLTLDALDKLTQATQQVSRTLQADAKVARIQFAMVNGKCGAFKYSETYQAARNHHYVGNPKTSEELMATIMMTFMTDQGLYVTGFVAIQEGQSYNQTGEQREKNSRDAFHAALIKQVHGLLGVKPLIQAKGDGRFAIHYE